MLTAVHYVENLAFWFFWGPVFSENRKLVFIHTLVVFTRLLQIWEFWWQKIQIMLWATLSYSMMIQGTSKPALNISFRMYARKFSAVYVFNLFIFGCSIPFSVDDISKSMPQTDLSDVDPPPVLRENPGFFFLQPQAAWWRTIQSDSHTRILKEFEICMPLLYPF